jgi:uncharacterized protein
MNCPTCNVTLLLAEKQGVEIDYCPQCRGIWLDRGELEKIIEKANQTEPSRYTNYHEDKKQVDYDDPRYANDNRNKRKKGFLGDLFDF